jgi:NAD(P)-dependent dehydrogenase (short-subunit alcohol dehydrogenase family)
MSKAAVVTGAGSGVGRAVALELSAAGWDVAIVGRTQESLEQTVALAKSGAGRIVPFACDVTDEGQVDHMVESVVKSLGPVAALVNCAGTNVKKRSLAEASVEEFDAVLNVNLRGAFLCIRAFLPGMRQRRSGTIVNVNSDAGLVANPYSGAAYTASKFGLTGLTQTINAEERKNGIRACGVFPGEIDTGLLEKRPVVPTEEAREKMLRPEDVANCVMLAISLPERAVVEMLVVRPLGK